ncbi:hypothetical protein ACVIHF_002883 [Bradyrhizobium sp. USDA 4506]
MEQRLRLRGRIEIATLRIEQQVCRETRACRNLLSKGHQLARHQKLPSGNEGGDQDDDQGRKNPANATRIERRKAEAPVLNVAIDDPGDQVAGNDEEDVDPDETPGNILRERVAEHDQRDGNGPQAVDIRPIILVVVPHRPLAPGLCLSLNPPRLFCKGSGAGRGASFDRERTESPPRRSASGCGRGSRRRWSR